jgi:integrase
MGMKWAELDFDAKTWDLPAVRTKNRRPHSVPLPSTALALLERRRAATPVESHVCFPG